MPKRSKPQTIEYAFRFAQGTNTERARMVEMIRVNLAELLKMVQLTAGGQAVQVDGFALRDAPQTHYDVHRPVAQEEDRGSCTEC
jgi:hypothetical protein